VFAGRRAELPAQPQPSDRHQKAHDPKQGHCQRDRVAHRSERKSDREIVQAQRRTADQQPPPVPERRNVVAAAQCLNESPDRGHEQYRGAGPAGGGPQRAGQAGADEHPGGGHHDVAQAENRGYLDLGPPAYSADPDGDRRPEVVQPKRDRHDKERYHHQIKQHPCSLRHRNLCLRRWDFMSTGAAAGLVSGSARDHSHQRVARSLTLNPRSTDA
jgi:hypothetical protein